jgi:hypothetical protein
MGRDHPDVGTTSMNLASVYVLQKRCSISHGDSRPSIRAPRRASEKGSMKRWPSSDSICRTRCADRSQPPMRPRVSSAGLDT